MQEAGVWRQSYLDFFQHHLLPPNRSEAMKIQMKSLRFFVKDDLLLEKDLIKPPSDAEQTMRWLKSPRLSTVTKLTPQLSRCIACPLRDHFIPECFDVIGPITTFSSQHMDPSWHQCYIKWIEALAFKRASGAIVTSFVQDSIICRVGMSKPIFWIMAHHLLTPCARIMQTGRGRPCQAEATPKSY